MSDVCLVSMPYGCLGRPNIGIGLLVAAAKRKGIKARACYLNFLFAEKIGIHRHIFLRQFQLALEWTFSGAAFPHHKPDHEKFLKDYLRDVKSLQIESPLKIKRNEDIYRIFREVRERAPAFVEEAAEKILKMNPKIVGCSSSFWQHCASLALLRIIKKKSPGVITLMGGANCEGIMGKENKRSFPWIDFVVAGEADLLFPDLCQMLLGKDRDLAINELPYGVISKKNSMKSEQDNTNPIRAMVEDLNSLPLPDYDDYFAELEKFTFKEKIYPVLVAETSRGCWWGQKKPCTFCGLNGSNHHFRTKNPQRVFNEIEELQKRYKVNTFAMTDNILPQKYFKSLLPRIAMHHPASYFFFWEVKPDLKEKNIKILSKAGVRKVQAGIESLHDGSLALLNKGVSALQNVNFLKIAMEKGVRVEWNFLVDIPREQNEWYEEIISWLPLIYHLQPPDFFGSIRFDRFSTYHRNEKDFGLNLSPSKGYRYLYPLSIESLNDLVYYFKDNNNPEEKQRAPAISKLRKMICQWQTLFDLYQSKEKRVLLSMSNKGSYSSVTDTRPCALKKKIILEGPSYSTLQLCRKPCSRSSLYKSLREVHKVGLKESERLVDDLVKKKLLLLLNGKLLSLPLQEPLKPLITDTEFFRGNTVMSYVLDSILQYSSSE